MDKNKFSTVLIILIPQIIALITREYALAEKQAVEQFYNSKLYKTLEEEETKLWHLSAHALFEMYQEELATGSITYPEEA